VRRDEAHVDAAPRLIVREMPFVATALGVLGGQDGAWRTASRGRGTLTCRRGSQGDNGIPAQWLPLGPKDEREGGRGEEPNQEGPQSYGHRTTHCDHAAERPIP